MRVGWTGSFRCAVRALVAVVVAAGLPIFPAGRGHASEGVPVGAGEPGASPTSRNAITLEPLAVVFARTVSIEYERGLGNAGVHVSVALALGDISLGSDERRGDYLSLAATLGFRLYPWSDAPRGFFFGPFASVAWVEAETITQEEVRTAAGVGWAVGALAGWTWVLGTSFIVSGGAGAAWYDLALDVDGDRARDTAGGAGLLPTVRLAVGALF